MQVIYQITQYKTVILHAPSTIQGLLSINTGNPFSYQNLYTKLSTAECDTCGDVGGYLYLPLHVAVFVFSASPAGREDIAGLPSMKSVPGHYSPREIKYRTRLTLIDHEAAREAGIAVHGSMDAMVRHTSETTSKRLEQYESRKSSRRADGPNMRRPRSEDDFDGHSSNPRRFLGIVRVPLLNAQPVIHLAQAPKDEWNRQIQVAECKLGETNTHFDAILDKKFKEISRDGTRKIWQYRVKWLGQTGSWEPASLIAGIAPAKTSKLEAQKDAP